MAEMCHGLFIFDEIHVYEPHTTALILSTIEELVKLNCIFLFMSATFPRFLKDKIRSLVPNITEHTLDEKEPEDCVLLKRPRHQVVIQSGEVFDYVEDILSQLSSGKRVLVVCNTVKRAQEVYQILQDSDHISTLLHGRFILQDRERIEREIRSVQLLVGTQAVEVSLDIDFDTLFTEPAPIDALLQRFGRVNRRGNKGVVPVHIFTLGSEKDFYFYDKSRVETTISVLSGVNELTETEAANLVEEVYANGYNEKEQQEYDFARESFRHVIDNLLPFDDSTDDEEFENLIRSVEVVPECFEQDYIECLENRQFFEAMRYLAGISFGQGMRLRKLEAISLRRYKTEYGSIYSYLVAHVKYDSNLGLLLDEIEKKGVFVD